MLNTSLSWWYWRSGILDHKTNIPLHWTYDSILIVIRWLAPFFIVCGCHPAVACKVILQYKHISLTFTTLSQQKCFKWRGSFSCEAWSFRASGRGSFVPLLAMTKSNAIKMESFFTVVAYWICDQGYHFVNTMMMDMASACYIAHRPKLVTKQ